MIKDDLDSKTVSQLYEVLRSTACGRDIVKAKDPEGQYRFLWNVLDKESRFQLASEISQTRNEVEVMNAFNRAREMAETIPNQITSDMMGAYPMVVERTFIDVRPELRPKHNIVQSEVATKSSGDGRHRSLTPHHHG